MTNELLKEYSATLAKKFWESEAMKALPEVKTLSKKYRMVISKQVSDRDNEVIKIAGIDHSAYMRNPVVLTDHTYKVGSIAGKTTALEKTETELIAEFVFADTELGKLCEKLHNGGFLKASSIGFMVRERDRNDFFVINSCELLERSFVAIGSNREALSLEGKEYDLGIEKGIIIKEAQQGAPVENDKVEEVVAPTIPEPAAEEDTTEIDPSTKNYIDTKFARIEEMLQPIVDGKAAVKTENELKIKENVQLASRAAAEACRLMKDNYK